MGGGVGLGEGFDVGGDVEPGVEVAGGVEPALVGVALGVAPAAGVEPGDVFATAVGDAAATPDTTRSPVCAWHAFFQQILTT